MLALKQKTHNADGNPLAMFGFLLLFFFVDERGWWGRKEGEGIMFVLLQFAAMLTFWGWKGAERISFTSFYC